LVKEVCIFLLDCFTIILLVGSVHRDIIASKDSVLYFSGTGFTDESWNWAIVSVLEVQGDGKACNNK
jgi:hypothetical protein